MLSCSEYDYIEIVCMFNYPIKLTMKSGDVIECTALDTARNEHRNECLKVKLHDSEALIVLDDVLKLTVLIANPHFTEVAFD